MSTDYKRYPVLYVDDEPPNLVTFRYALEDRFHVLTASSGAEAIEILRAQDVAVLMADQRMPGMNGAELCEQAIQIRPEAVRIIVTAHSDVHAAVSAINQGRVSHYLAKPWNNDALVDTLQTCIDLVHVQRSMRDLEQRLLRGGPVHVAFSARREVLHGFAAPLTGLAFHVQQAHETVHAVLTTLHSLQDPRTREAGARLLQVQSELDAARDLTDFLRKLHARLVAADRSARHEAPSCDAARIVETTVRVVRGVFGSDVEIRVVLRGAPMVQVPPSVLGEIVLNLLTNAVQAVRGGSGLERSVTVSVDADGDMGILRVEDTGPGIPPEDMQQIFDAHFTTKADATGFGLFIVRDLVQRAGGTTGVESTLGAGTSFEIRLPRGAPP